MATEQATGKWRTYTYRVWSLDVWGHAPADCPNGPAQDMDADGDAPAHECTCEGYSVNDRSEAGNVKIACEGYTFNPGTPHAFDSWCPSPAEILAALQREFLKDSLTVDDVDIDTSSGAESDITIDQASDGRPVFQLECEGYADGDTTAE